MSSKNRKQPLITDEQVKGIVDVMTSLGADPQDRYGLATSLRNIESYWGGVFEWTDRAIGVRLWVQKRLFEDQVVAANVAAHGLDLPDEEIRAANERLLALFK